MTQTKKTELPKLITQGELATVLGIEQDTLRSWRYKGIGPKFIRVGKHRVRYHPDDINDFINSNRYEATRYYDYE